MFETYQYEWLWEMSQRKGRNEDRTHCGSRKENKLVEETYLYVSGTRSSESTIPKEALLFNVFQNSTNKR